jgi:cell division protein FtsZ
MREMGKAMMGTGEATGEKRALRAAEAAISNPLIDDVSMRGAHGLLISITGGKDLTLYEVDEAATRIREEVDPDANIIVGATFDESLDGVIRVSVVATGVDEVAMAAPRTFTPEQQTVAVTNHQSRIAELTQRLRADSQRLQERLERANPQPIAAAAPPASAAPAAVETVGTAAVAAALEDVTIRTIPPKPSLYEAPAKPAVAEPAPPKAFIPPAAERPGLRPSPRMPHIDEFPIPAQNAIRAKQAEAQGADAGEAGDRPRMSLLKRLASLGRHEGEEQAERPAPRPQLPPLPERTPQRPIPQARKEPVSEYAKQGAPQGLDQHGRQVPVHNGTEDDQLEIPAFLRRQAT